MKKLAKSQQKFLKVSDMRQLMSRLVLVAAAALWLSGCGATNIFNEFKPGTPGPTAEADAAMAADASVTATKTTTVVTAEAPQANPLSPVAPADDDAELGRKYYRVGAFGLAEKYFRRAVEAHPNRADAWLGLAASYDRLKRFDLADRAYAQALRLAGPVVEIINNQGYSYMLRGDYKMAREKLRLARSKAPDNQFVKNNLQLLSAKTGGKPADAKASARVVEPPAGAAIDARAEASADASADEPARAQ